MIKTQQIEYVKDTFAEYLGKTDFYSASDIKNFLKSPKLFFYDKYTTYGSLYDMTHDDPTNDPQVFQSLFDQFLQEKNIKLSIDQKEISRDHLKKLYSLNKKM